MAGVESTGFVTKTVDDIEAEIKASQVAELGADLNQSSTSLLGVLNGIFAAMLSENWEVAEAIFSSFDPDRASGAALDHLCQLTGVTRLAAQPSTVTLTATGTPATVLTVGRQVRVPDNDAATFETLAEATIAAVAAWAAATGYIVGDRVENNSRIYQCTTAGTSAGSGGPTGTGTGIADNTAVWTYLGEGTGVIDVEAECTGTGPTVANARTVTEIVTPQSGWDSVINVQDADLGRDLETDAALRLRREDSLRRTGDGPVEAIRADVLAVDGVTECFVFENITDATDGDGMPPHSYEVVVRGGADADIRAAIFGSGAAGIVSHGTTSGTVTDSQGFDHTIKHTRPDDVTVHVIIDVTTDPDTFPADGATQIKTAVATWAQTSLGIGDDVIQSQLYSPVFSISGVIDVTKIWIGFADPPTTDANLTITSREIADIDTANIDVNVT